MIDVKDKFIIAGDWHGNAPQGLNVIQSAKIRHIPAIIHVGDFGIWFNDKPYLNKLERALKEADIHLYFIDGNHEDFNRLYEKRFNEDGTRYVRDHIHYLPRGFRWEWGGVTFMGLGGAASIDQKFRRINHSWWPQELLTDEDVANAIAGGKVDVMFTHDSPASAPNSITDNLSEQMAAAKFYGRDILDICTDHRIKLAEVTDVVTPKILFHGHYHRYMTGSYRHNDADRSYGRVIGLDQGQGPFRDHTYIFDIAEEKADLLVDTTRK